MIDPRSLIVYLAFVLSQGARYGVPWRERLRTAARGLAAAAVIADGRLVAAGRIPAPDEVLAVLDRPVPAAAISPGVTG